MALTIPAFGVIAGAPAPDSADSLAQRLWLFVGTFHPLVVHFPIALILVGAVLELARRTRGRPSPSKTAQVCLTIGALSAIVAAVLGWSDAQTAGQQGAAGLLFAHRWLGVCVAGLAVLCAVLAGVSRIWERHAAFAGYRAALVLSALLVAVTGHLGGSMVYGENYVQNAVAEFFPEWDASGGAVIVNAAAAGPAAGAVTFDDDIAPIFVRRCNQCHTGQDPESGMRVDSREALLKGGESGKPAIVPGKPEESYLYRLVSGQEKAAHGLVMPPKGKPLDQHQVKAIRDWIERGALWTGDSGAAGHWHWAYKPPERHNPPPVKNAYWSRNPIDHFVLAKLDAEGLAPSPEADRETLIRRVSLDLTGLPPTPPEIDAFLNDRGGGAYERVVERLLASPHYGERWARPWLDLARYADTHGYEKDNRRVMWPYRDWVIGAFNRDMPFDQFTIEQIAGDMLDRPTRDQIIATAFNRNTMINEEGGVDPEEFRCEAIVDRVNTAGFVWLGSTVACAQCHDHKYDPIKHTDYYGLFAIFNQDQSDTRTHAFGADAGGPMIDVPKREHWEEFDRLEGVIAELKKTVGTQTLALDAAQAAWEVGILTDAARWTVLTPSKVASAAGATLSVLPDGSVLAGGTNPDVDTYTVEIETDLSGIGAVRLEVLPDESQPSKGVGRTPHGNFVLTDFSLSAVSGSDPSAPAAAVVWRAAGADYEQSGNSPQEAFTAVGAFDADPAKTGWAIAGKTGEPHAAVFRPNAAIGAAGGSRLTFTLACNYGGQHTLGRFRLSAATSVDGLSDSPVSPSLVALVQVPAEKRTQAQRDEIAVLHRSITPLLAEARQILAEKQARSSSIMAARMLVMSRGEPRETFVHVRGSFLAKGEKVEAKAPAFLPQIPEGTPATRLSFARWLVDPGNPLTARVTVNRFWEQFFGRGIVETSEDFGTQGEFPVNQGLLDWMATEFVRQGWSVKSLHRLIMTSATYRQSSRVTPEMLQRDPYNRLLSRGPRFRVEAEMIRDVALAASGLLSPKIGGPSVFPPQPEGTWTMIYNDDKWVESQGEDRYRRGLYTFWRRTAPYPTFAGLDAPSREIVCTRRSRTNTPLQALAVLNDPAFVEAAAALARKMVDEGGADPAGKVIYGFRRCVARRPSQQEIERLVALYRQQIGNYSGDQPGATALTAVGPAGQGGAYDPAEVAAWTVVANVLLNLDETLTKG